MPEIPSAMHMDPRSGQRIWRNIGTCILTLSVQVGIQGQYFTNVAEEQGIDILVESDLFGSGVSFHDIDNDGWDDLTFCVKDDSLVVYRNDEGQFHRLPSFLFLDGETKHVLWVDHDNDGDMDLTVTTWMGTYRLFENDGAFSFTDISASAGLAQNNEHTYGCAWGDYDRDGDLDLYVCLYEYEGNQNNFSRMNHLYRNNGNGTFTDVTLEAGVSDGIKLSFQAVWMDYDNDGWPDLYVINDRWFSNSMYRNNGDGTFTDVTQATGTAVPEQDPMTASVADFDNDGDLDIYMTNTGVFAFIEKRGMLMVNNGDGTFTERAGELGVDIWTWSWGATWVDVDNDSWQDLYVATSMPNSTIEDNVFYLSDQGEQFNPAPQWFTSDHNARSFAVARGDLNNDGAYELVVQNQTPYHPFLWLNSGNSNHFVKVTIQGTVSNRSAIGSWIRVYAGGNVFTQYTHCGENYTSQNSQHHIIGLGTIELIDSIQVEYPSGHTDTYYDPAADQHHFMVEGETYYASILALGPLTFCEGDTLILDAGDHESYLWDTGSTERFITVTTSGEHWVTVQNEFGIEAFSDTIVVSVLPSPIIEASTQNPLCSGDITGSIILTNLLGIEAQSVTWSNGGSGAILTDLSAGIHDYAFTDVNGCTSSGSLELTEPTELFVQMTIEPVTSGNNGAIEVLVFGGTPPYTIHLNGEEASTFNTGLSIGTYVVEITDSNGCQYQEVVEVDGNTFVHETSIQGSSVFPNPVRRDASLMVYTPLANGLIKIGLFDALGRSVAEVSTDLRRFIVDPSTLQHLPPGPYLVRVHWDKHIDDHVIIVQ